MYIISVCSILLFYIVIKFIWNVLYISDCLKSIPGSPPVFFFGNILELLGYRGMIDVFNDYTKKYGTLVKGRAGPFLYGLLVTDGEFMKQVLLGKTNLSKGRIYDMTKCWLGEGLLTSEESKWKNQRKMLNSAFSSKILMDSIPVFDRQANILTEKFRKLIPTDAINIHQLLSLCSLDIICETTMGVSINSQMNEDLEYVGVVRDMCTIIVDRSMSPWKIFEPLFWLSSDYRKQKKCLQIIRKHVNNVIAKKQEQRRNMKKRSHIEELDEFGRKQKLALLDILLEYSESDESLSREEIEDEVHTFMFAGHDTSTATMDFVIFELARNPKIQELAFQEQKQIFEDDRHREVDLADIQNMKYLDMVIKETLRLYPPVSVIARKIDEEFKYRGGIFYYKDKIPSIDQGNYVIPSGIVILFFLYGLHRNAELFPNPEVFDPSRFENPDSVTPFSFLPFSTGPRNCIGQKFAMYEIKVILSRLLRNFEFLSAIPEHNLDLRAEVVLTSRNGVKVKMVPRR